MRSSIAIVIMVSLMSACAGAGPTSEDEARKQQLVSEFGSRYTFEFDDIYLRAKSKSGTPTKVDAERIFSAFWLNDGKPRATSSLVYANMYDARGKFVFQALWEPKEQRIVFSLTEHY
ncbi:MAG TPA: hypothetical protein VF618_13660 [Thermoanaerobaculia bacterium]